MQCHRIVNGQVSVRDRIGKLGNQPAQKRFVQVNRTTQRAQPDNGDALGNAECAKPEIHKLIELLRQELAGYGSMLLLLDQQWKLILSRRAEALLENAGSLGAQVQTLASIRTTRQRLGREVAAALGCEDLSSFGELVASVPEEYQTLLRALVGEINWILFQCQQRLLQNKLLLGPPPTDPTLAPQRGGLIFFGLN